MNIKKDERYCNLIFCDLCVTEIGELYQRDKGNQKEYANWLDKKLRLLDSNGLLMLERDKQSFEKLKGVKEGIYSIRKRTHLGNPRVLFYTIEEENEKTLFLFLAAFHELRAGDYKLNIERAVSRKKQIMGMLSDSI